jgi:hypothetical protein
VNARRRPRVVSAGVAIEPLRPVATGSSLARWSRVALPALAAVVALLVALASIDPSVLCVLPALVLALVLALRRYPGENTLVALRRHRRHGRARRTPSALRRPRRWLGRVVPRGGLLLACSLADRPPPPVALAAR